MLPCCPASSQPPALGVRTNRGVFARPACLRPEWASTLEKHTAFLKQTRLPRWRSTTVKDHHRTHAGISFTMGERKCRWRRERRWAEDNAEAQRHETEALSSPRDFLIWGKCQENPKIFNFGWKSLVKIPATKRLLFLLGTATPLCCQFLNGIRQEQGIWTFPQDVPSTFFVLQNQANRVKLGTVRSWRTDHSPFVAIFMSNEAASSALKLLIYCGQSASQAHWYETSLKRKLQSTRS